MALKNRDASLIYLRIKDGKFHLGKDGETYDELEGVITDIRFKDEEYEGQPQRKAYFQIEDDGERYALGLNVENAMFGSLVSFLANADVSKKLTLHPKETSFNKDGKDLKSRSLLVSQNGKFVKGYFTKDNPNGLPKWNIQQVGKKVVTDKSEYTEFLEKFLVDNIVPKLLKGQQESKPISKEAVEDTEPEVLVSTDKMPWED